MDEYIICHLLQVYFILLMYIRLLHLLIFCVRYTYVYPSRSHNLSGSCLLQRILHVCQCYAPCDRYNKENIQSYLQFFKNRHCALCHGVNDVESFDVRFTVSDKLVDKLLSDLANLSKSEKIEHMMLHFSFKEIPPKDFVPRPCILHL
jgi:hypothetical protein